MFASKDLFLTRPSGYQISRSVRLRSSASAYFNRTAGTPTNANIWTWSAWVKRGTLTTRNTLFCGGSTNVNYICFGDSASTDNFGLTYSNSPSQLVNVQTTAVYRDPGSWYHLMVVYDSTSATSTITGSATDRVRLYINGVQITSFSATTPPAQNTSVNINAASAVLNLGRRNIASPDSYFDGYMTEMNFIDGQALTPSSFGQTNAVTGIWQPIKYTGTYGTNGFYLNFSDNSGVTATTIGKDYSGNGNNWTPSAGISITAGATYDSMIDVPTLYADGGNGRGNYAVLNPLSVVSPTTLADGNLGVVTGTTGGGGAFSTITIPTSGKYYFEFIATAVSATLSDNARIGLATASVGNYVLYKSDGNKVVDGTTSAYGSSFALNDVIGCAVDVDGGTVTFYKNNVSQGSITYSTSNGNYFAHTQDGSGTVSVTANINFGQRPFAYTPPTGYSALNTQNLPTPTISNGATVMAATLYTGNGTSQTIANTVNGVSMKPDMVWVKDRSSARSHILSDSVRGTSYSLYPNETTAEATSTARITAFNSNGFSIGDGLGVNASTETFVGWQWQAGQGSTSSNTSGSITSTVSVNATAGFSVVTYTGTAANATVGHGLGVAPSMIITKNRDSATAWWVYHKSLGNTQYLVLNTTAAAVTSSSAWNNTSPTSTVFSLGAANPSNANQDVAYCFAAVAGYSAFGSYTGNGSADGPFIYLGFRPRWVMIKNTTSGAGYDWEVYDTSRGAYNLDNQVLYPDLANAEATPAAAGIDVLSNGFKIRFANGNNNPSGATMIYAAFAENPFKLSLAR